MDLKINNSEDASVKSGKWKDPGASFYDQLLQCYHYEGGIPADSNELDELIKKGGYKTWMDFLKEAYLVAPVSKINNSPHGVTPYSRSGCKYPHHVIRNGELVVHQAGLRAAYTRAKQMGIFSGEIKEHLEKHYKELGLYDQSTMKMDESMEQNFSDIEAYIFENTGIDLYSTVNLFEERSHGKLNSSFRRAINVENGHIVKIVFDLNTNDATQVGPHNNASSSSAILSKIAKLGHNNFASAGTVKAIIDLDTNKRLRSVTAVGFLGFFNKDGDADNEKIKKAGTQFYIPDEFSNKVSSDEFEKCNVREREVMAKKIGHSIHGIKYTVSEKETSPTYKATSGTLVKHNGDTTGFGLWTGEDFQNRFDNGEKLRLKGGRTVKDARSLEPFIKSIHKESVDIYQEAIDCMNDIDQFLFEQSQNKPSEMNIYPLNRTDVTSPYFVKWLFKTDEFCDDDPEKFDFDVLVNNPERGNHVYGYYINNLEGIIRIRDNNTFRSISMLFVNAESEGNGIGQSLLKYAIEKYGDIDLKLNVFTFNKRAIHIYEKYGFKITDTHTVQEEPGESNKFVGKKMYVMTRSGTPTKGSPYVVMERHHKYSEEGLKVENVGSDDLSWVESYLMEDSENAPTVNKGEPPPKPTEPAKPAQPENPEKKESMPQKAAKAESSANGVRRKKLYIAFIEWAKSINPKNTFGSIFDKDAFNTIYPFIDHEMRYFYRLANPLLCVLTGDLTFFAAAELKKLNMKNSRLSEMMIFAATKEDVRVFNKKDKKVYRGVEENGMLKLAEVLGETFDTYLQKMINQGDILNGPIEESVEILPPMNQEGRVEL